MFESTTLLGYLATFLSFIGFGGIVAGVVVRVVGKKIDRAEQNRDAREEARIAEIVLLHEGQCAIGHLAEATANALKDGKVNGKVDRALEHYHLFREHNEAFLRLQAARQTHGGD